MRSLSRGRRALPWLLVALAIAGVGEGARADTEVGTSKAYDDAIPDSVSCGATNRGALSDSAELPVEGTGYVIAEPWRSRELRYGTREIVGLVQRVAARVARELPGAVLGVGDLSSEDGGAIGGHRSHQSGRDVDLIFYALDRAGQPFPPDEHMAYYRPTGAATYAQAPQFIKDIPTRYFDLARNWALVRALVTDLEAPASQIFVSRRVRQWLLLYAEEIGEPETLVRDARRALRQVGGHNDHLHVRIACSADDVALGRCQEMSAPHRRRGRWRRNVPCPRPVPPPELPVATAP